MRSPFRSLRLHAALLACAATMTLAGCDREPLHGIVFEDPEPAAPLVLTNASGATFDLAATRDSLVLIYFGYTHCPDVCPTTMSDWANAKRALGDRASRVKFVLVSVDPARDTKEIVQAYARQFDPTFIGLTGSEAEIDALKAAWRFAAYPEGDPRTRDYSVAHPAHTYLVDARGALRVMFEPGVGGEQLARDLRKLF